MFYEHRRYHIFPGKMEEWIKFIEGTIIPFQVAKGMVITGSFRAEDDDSVYVWMRRFNSEEERVQLYKDVYEDEQWVSEIGPRVAELIDRSKIQVTRLVPTPHSVIQ